MNRRQAGQAMLLGAVAAALPGVALAQGMGGPERRHAEDTLRIGGVALRSSQLAQQRVRGGRIRQFADFEVAEQTTVAAILQRAGYAPTPPDQEARDIMARLERFEGVQFEDSYLRTQVDGHQKLLALQQRYIAEGRNETMMAVAMLARGQIREHLQILHDIRERRA